MEEEKIREEANAVFRKLIIRVKDWENTDLPEFNKAVEILSEYRWAFNQILSIKVCKDLTLEKLLQMIDDGEMVRLSDDQNAGIPLEPLGAEAARTWKVTVTAMFKNGAFFVESLK